MKIKLVNFVYSLIYFNFNFNYHEYPFEPNHESWAIVIFSLNHLKKRLDAMHMNHPFEWLNFDYQLIY